MPRYRLGLQPYCPLDNVTVRGVNFGRLTGAPGKDQVEGVLVEMSTEKMSDLKRQIDEREIRFIENRGAKVCLVNEDRGESPGKDPKTKALIPGPILRGPGVRKCAPLNKFLTITKDGVKPDPVDDPSPLPDIPEHNPPASDPDPAAASEGYPDTPQATDPAAL